MPAPAYPETIRDAISHALGSLYGDGSLPSDPAEWQFVVERPRDRTHGDWATNAALVGAGRAGMSPRHLAALLVEHLPEVPFLVSAEIAGPGFVNFTLSGDWYLEVLRRAATEGPDHARTDDGAGERIQVEFVSVNPNGPLHIGHARGGVVGDVIARLLGYVGHPVQREYYYNDAGAQMTRYAASLDAAYRRALGENAEIPEDGYHGEYVTEWGAELAAERGDALAVLPEGDRLAEVLAWGLARAMGDIEETLAMVRIPFDAWFSEQTLHDRGEVDEALRRLEAAGYLYREEGATWFRSSAFGDEKDRVVVTSDGRYTYIVPDIAYHLDKFERGFDRVINIWGADHHGYIPRLKASLEALGFDPGRLEIVITQLVNIARAGEPVRMSTRAGEFITFREVVDEVGADAVRYFLAAYSPDTPITFDLDEAKRQSMDNPVYYLQYAHARMRSLEDYAAGQGVRRLPLADTDLSLLVHPAEIEVLKQCDRLREEVREAALRRAPHRITAYGYDVATAFHRFYTDCRIVTDDEALTHARLWLVEAAKSVMLATLGLLGITAPDRM
ncbi:MAG: arginine--tRNA ligase [Actinobacteria bacterium]|nr:arginine--tRNA ligase [Actinomycetota bacterium]MBU1493812.1 arginine--tRNA ligase [Actinomycetota bacterium]